MPYQYKREPLSDDEVNKLTNACETFREKFVIWTLLDTGLRLSEFADLKKRECPVAGKKASYLWQGWFLWEENKKKNHPHDREGKKINGVSLCRKQWYRGNQKNSWENSKESS